MVTKRTKCFFKCCRAVFVVMNSPPFLATLHGISLVNADVVFQLPWGIIEPGCSCPIEIDINCQLDEMTFNFDISYVTFWFPSGCWSVHKIQAMPEWWNLWSNYGSQSRISFGRKIRVTISVTPSFFFVSIMSNPLVVVLVALDPILRDLQGEYVNHLLA